MKVVNCKVQVTSLAHHRYEAMEKVGNLRETLHIHLVKLIVWPKHESAHHWQNEVRSCIAKIYPLKIKKKGQVSGDYYHDHLWDDFSDDFTAAVRRVLRAMEEKGTDNELLSKIEPLTKAEQEKVAKKMDNFFCWLRDTVNEKKDPTELLTNAKLASILK